MKAIERSLRITPKKLNLIAELVRNKDANEALEMLKFTPKKGAKLMYKALKSAVTNATNNFKQESENLFVKEIIVTKAATIKRWVPASRGRAQPILKRNAHLTINIGLKEGAKAKKAEAKKEPEAKKEETTAKVKKAPAKKTTTSKKVTTK